MDDQHKRVQDLFLEALEKEPTERLDYAKKLAGGDTEIFAELEKLLRIDENDARLDAPISPVILSEMFETPDRIGDYEILGVLGEGGMGVVYEARQSNPQRSVALKVLRFDGNEEALRRFKHEAEVLGFLQHPNIAQVYEAGVTTGALGDRPYFSMERVHGVRIDRFASERGLSPEQCVELMLGVLDGISHAHQKGIVHRDLKPANLLVTDEGQPKILDFGVARVASLEGEETMMTRTGEVVGTLAFMSPEQVAADPSAIDTRADIYALGVVLYRLLSGMNPIDLDGVTTIEALRRVTQKEPRPLLEVAGAVDEDLATIVHKALEKEKDRRYASAREFSADLRRYLACEPVLARAPSRLYIAKRFVQRHRGVTFAGSIAVLALLGGAITSTSLFLSEQRTNADLLLAQSELQQSNASLQEANQLADERLRAANRRLSELDSSASLIQQLLGDPLPFEDGKNLLFATVVERSADRVLSGFHEFPMQRAWLAIALGNNARRLNLTEKARALLDAGRESYGQTSEKQPLVQMQLDYLETEILMSETRYDEALAMWERMLETDYEAPPASSVELQLRARYRMGACLNQLGRPEEAIALLDRSIEFASQLDAPHSDQTPAIFLYAADSLLVQGDFRGAKKRAEECLEYVEAHSVDDIDLLSGALHALGSALINLGQLPEARAAFEESVRHTAESAGPAHPLTAVRKGNLATIRRRMGEVDGAIALYNEAVDGMRGVGLDMHREFAGVLSNRASLLIELGELEAAEADLEECGTLLDHTSGVTSDVSRAYLKTYDASIQIARGDLDGAERTLREAIADKTEIFGTEAHPITELDFRDLARIAYLRGDFVQCVELEIQNAQRNALIYGPDHPSVELSFNQAGRILDRYERQAGHDPDTLEELRSIVNDQRL